MKYSKVYMESMGYELAPVVVTSRELEACLVPVYSKLKLSEGQLEELTGIYERRWWEPDYPLSKGAIAAAKKALAASNVRPKDLGILIYASVGHDYFEPAMACAIANSLGISPDAVIYDVSNACLAAVNGIINIANAIELGQARAGLVVSCESARDIVEAAIRSVNQNPSMKHLMESFTTFTGGSSASALLITDGSFSDKRHKLIGGVCCTEPKFHDICRWEMQPVGDGKYIEIMRTDALAVLKNGVKLGERTWKKFKEVLGWDANTLDKTVCHQVAAKNREMILKTMGIAEEKDFFTYPYLGNIGTVSLPITAAIAEERDFLHAGEKVGFFGIGSGLNCLGMGWEW